VSASRRAPQATDERSPRHGEDRAGGLRWISHPLARFYSRASMAWGLTFQVDVGIAADIDGRPRLIVPPIKRCGDPFG